MKNELELTKAIEKAINSYNAEWPSDTPDFILAEFLMGCLTAWNRAVLAREKWYGRKENPTTMSDPQPPKEHERD